MTRFNSYRGIFLLIVINLKKVRVDISIRLKNIKKIIEKRGLTKQDQNCKKEKTERKLDE